MPRLFRSLRRSPAPAPINDPLRHASDTYGHSFRPVTSCTAQEDLCYHTTGEFSRLSRRYRSHCCPTAITNILFSLYHAGKAPMLTDRKPADIFEECASYGSRRLLYWNMFLLNFFGGVSIPLSGVYLRSQLKRWDIHPRHLHPCLLFPRDRLIRSMQEGHLGMICVLFHPIYASHTMMVCGLDILKDDQGTTLYYVRLADGWASRPRYLCINDLKRFMFWDLSM